MLINADDLEVSTIHTPICIVGSGIGGTTVASELAKLGREFYVIEAGGLSGNAKTVSIDNVGLPFGLSTTTSIELGGTSNLWHGVLSKLDPADYKKRDWIHNSGWPITAADLEPFYKKAADLFSILHYEYLDVEGLSAELKAKLAEMPFNRDYLVNHMFQQPLPSKRFKKTLKEITLASQKQHCVYNAAALELITDPGGRTITKLTVKGRGNKTITVEAGLYILAAGALQTPRLLLNSKALHPKGIGNDHDLIGRYLLDHPMGNLLQLEFKEKRKAHIYSEMKYAKNNKIKTGLTFSDDVQEKYRLPNHNFYVRPSFVKGIDNKSEKIKLALLTFLDRDKGITAKDAFEVITHFNVVMQILAYKFSLNVVYRYADLFFVTEQIPNPESRVTLSDKLDEFGYPIARVNWQITDADMESMVTSFRLLRDHGFSEKDFIFVHKESDLDWKGVFTSGAHHVGTTRMGLTAQQGVVDPNLKVHGIDNLYVADGSVFPTAGHVNSGFTIAALALRLASHLGSVSSEPKA